MAEHLQVDIVTPESQVFSGLAGQVVAPGWYGELGILPNHDIGLVLLRAGRVTVQATDGHHHFVVGRGFIEIGPDRVTLLTKVCEGVTDVDKEAARVLLQDAESRMKTVDPMSAQWEIASQDAELAHARLSA